MIPSSWYNHIYLFTCKQKSARHLVHLINEILAHSLAMRIPSLGAPLPIADRSPSWLEITYNIWSLYGIHQYESISVHLTLVVG